MGVFKKGAGFRKAAHCTKAASPFAVPWPSDFGFITKLLPPQLHFFCPSRSPGKGSGTRAGPVEREYEGARKIPGKKRGQGIINRGICQGGHSARFDFCGRVPSD